MFSKELKQKEHMLFVQKSVFVTDSTLLLCLQKIASERLACCLRSWITTAIHGFACCLRSWSVGTPSNWTALEVATGTPSNWTALEVAAGTPSTSYIYLCYWHDVPPMVTNSAPAVISQAFPQRCTNNCNVFVCLACRWDSSHYSWQHLNMRDCDRWCVVHSIESSFPSTTYLYVNDLDAPVLLPPLSE